MLRQFLDFVCLRNCVFRVSLVTGLAYWERSNPALSLALRVLHDFLIDRMDGVTDRFSFSNFANFAMGCPPPMGLRLSRVLKVISEANITVL